MVKTYDFILQKMITFLYRHPMARDIALGACIGFAISMLPILLVLVLYACDPLTSGIDQAWSIAIIIAISYVLVAMGQGYCQAHPADKTQKEGN